MRIGVPPVARHVSCGATIVANDGVTGTACAGTR
jgi:hypothetical protein